MNHSSLELVDSSGLPFNRDHSHEKVLINCLSTNSLRTPDESKVRSRAGTGIGPSPYSGPSLNKQKARAQLSYKVRYLKVAQILFFIIESSGNSTPESLVIISPTRA